MNTQALDFKGKVDTGAAARFPTAYVRVSDQTLIHPRLDRVTKTSQAD